MAFFTRFQGDFTTNCYVFGDGDNWAVVDPGLSDHRASEKIRESSANPKVSILLTHGHFDHIFGVDNLLKQFPGSPVYVCKYDVPMLTDPLLNVSNIFKRSFTMSDVRTVKEFDDGDVINIGKYRIEVLRTPGHTLGSVLFVIRDEKAVFSGDTIFQGAYGRTDFPGGDRMQLIQSLENVVFSLPDEFKVYPGHGNFTSIRDERSCFSRHYI